MINQALKGGGMSRVAQLELHSLEKMAGLCGLQKVVRRIVYPLGLVPRGARSERGSKTGPRGGTPETGNGHPIVGGWLSDLRSFFSTLPSGRENHNPKIGAGGMGVTRA